LDILDDRLRVMTLDRNAEGDKIEPEEHPAQRTLVVGNQLQDLTGRPLGTFDTSIQVETDAGTMANTFRGQCWSCKHFNMRAWHALFQWMSTHKDGMILLNRMRAFLIGSRNVEIQNAHESQEGDIDVEHAMMACGICEPMSEILKDPVVMYPQCNCPSEIPDSGSPPLAFGDHFVPRDPESEKWGSMAFDSIMKAALGKQG